MISAAPKMLLKHLQDKLQDLALYCDAVLDDYDAEECIVGLLSEIERGGWQLVPKGLTTEMTQTFNEYHDRPYNMGSPYRAEHTWKAILTEAPRVGK
jgi:hypothetical protein